MRFSQLPSIERLQLAEEIEQRLTPAMSVLGIIFLLVVLGTTLAEPGTTVHGALEAASLALWAVFVVEFLARMAIAPSKLQFLRRFWWQAIFLLVPFLRFIRLVAILRVARSGRIVSAAVRSSRSASGALRDRVAWLAATTVIVVLAASQLLFTLEVFPTYGEALYRTALAAVAGEAIFAESTSGRIIDVALSVYSVAIFATLAGTFGSFMLERRTEERSAAAPPPPRRAAQAGPG